MTDLKSNARIENRAAGPLAEIGTPCYDTIGARQARLAEAICETFFLQLRLINAAMIELPLGWLRSDAKLKEPAPASAADEKAEVVHEIASAPSIAHVEPAAINEAPPATTAASASRVDATKQSRKKSSRKKTIS